VAKSRALQRLEIRWECVSRVAPFRSVGGALLEQAHMSSGNPTKSQQACASKASLRRCTLWIFLSPRKWVEQIIHRRAARPEIQSKCQCQMAQLRLHASVSSVRAPIWAAPWYTSLQGVEGSPCQPNPTECIRIITSHPRRVCSSVFL
jgi:hypothetical protein